MKKTSISGCALLAATAAVLSACSSTPSTPSPSGGEGGVTSDIVVGGYGGDFDRFLTKNTSPVYKAENPESDVVYASDAEGPRTTKMIAEKAGAGTYDVAYLTANSVQSMINAGTLQKLDQSRIGNWEHIEKNLLNDYCVPQIYTAFTITQNPDSYDAPIDSFKKFFSEETISTVGVVQDRYNEQYFAAAAQLAGGNPGNNWETGIPLIAKAGPAMQLYGSVEQLGQGLISGEVGATFNVKARGIQWAEQSGIEFENVVPEEGTVPISFYACIPANAKNVDGAYDFLNAALDKKGQAGFAQDMKYAPTVTNTDLSEAELGVIGFTEEEKARIFPVDYQYTASITPTLSEAWKRDVLER